jgi:hypothetical protein
MTDHGDQPPGTVPTPEPPQPDHVPTPDAEPLERGESTGGAMTGETGVLSAESQPDGFVPGERREIEDPQHAGVAGQLRHPVAEGTNDMTRNAPGSLAGPLATERASGLTGKQGESSMGFSTSPSAGTAAGAGATELSEREGGYGAEEGLSETDPAYRHESHLPPTDDEDDG